jgi:hypothetical protein
VHPSIRRLSIASISYPISQVVVPPIAKANPQGFLYAALESLDNMVCNRYNSDDCNSNYMEFTYMDKDFHIQGKSIQFSDSDVKKVAASMKPGTRHRVKYYARVQNQSYPARQLVVEMLRRKGQVMPDIVTYQAMQILRALGFEIIES